MVNVLHLSANSFNGGAAKVATTLHESLQSYCSITYLTEDRILASLKPHFIKGLIRIYFFFRRKVGRIPSILDRFEPQIYKSYSFIPSLFPFFIRFLDIDLIHLHWVQGEFVSIEDLALFNKPIVWTMHDSWPFSAAEHHQLDTSEVTCYDYALLPFFNPSRITYLRKELAWKNLAIYPVAPSTWMLSKASSSHLFRSKQITLIPNPIQLDTFKPLPKDQARTFLELDPSIKYLLVGSLASPLDPVKGLDLLFTVFQKLRNDTSSKIHILTFGSISGLDFPGFDCSTVGHVDSDEKLAIVHSAAHATLVPSRIETHSQTAAESICCGTPVVAFDATGNSSVVQHNQTGLLIPPYNTTLYANAIKKLLDGDISLCNPALFADASRKWDADNVARQYFSLYQSILC